MPFFREKLIWVPLYVFFIGFGALNLTKKVFITFLVSLVLVVTVADTVSSKIVKPLVGRVRPCHAEHLAHLVVERIPCGAGYSFTSSHATNHFGVAVCLTWFFGFLSKKWKNALYQWAALIGFSQIYVGVHYPFDVLSGAVLGLGIGWLCTRLLTRVFGCTQPNTSTQ